MCGGHGSFGGDAFAGGVIYIPCTSGVQALAYNQPARTFTPLWQGPVDAFGPPIVSAGSVWDIASGGFSGGGTKLYGLDPATGTPRYTLTLPSSVADHFASPSAAGGRLFLATGSSETAYTISANPAGAPGAGGAGRALLGESQSRLAHAAAAAHQAPRRPQGSRARRAALHADERQMQGHDHAAREVRRSFRRVKHKRVRRVSYVTLGHARFNHGKGSFSVTVTPRVAAARALLRRHHGRLALQVILAAPPSKTRKLARDAAAAPLSRRRAARRAACATLLGRADDQHRAGRVVGDLVRHRAEQEALGAGHALVADDDQVGLLLLGDVEDRVGRVALARIQVDLRRPPRARPPRPPRASRRRPRAG